MVAIPEAAIHAWSRGGIVRIDAGFAWSATTIHAMTKTTEVLTAVPRLESTPVIPTFPRIEVRAAKIADANAKIIHEAAGAFCASGSGVLAEVFDRWETKPLNNPGSRVRTIPIPRTRTPTRAMGERLSPKKITAKAIAMMVEDLSIGLTKVTGALERAAKKQSHDAPVASPERKRNR